jgi:superfamily II DNA/RNA helicase
VRFTATLCHTPQTPHQQPLTLTPRQVANLGFCPEIMDALAKRGIFSLFPVQAQVGGRGGGGDRWA